MGLTSKSRRFSWPAHTASLTLARSTVALRVSARTARSVSQSWCTTHVAAATWSRGTTKLRGAPGSASTATKTNHSLRERASCCAFRLTAQDVFRLPRRLS